MSLILKLLKVIISIIFPSNISRTIILKAEKTRNIMTSTPVLRFFWKVVTFPIILLADTLVAVIKLVFLWIFSQHTYGILRFMGKQFYTDLVKQKFGLKTTIKRSVLLWGLFTKGAEKRVSYGTDNPDKTFYVIRPYYFQEPNEYIFQNVPNLLTQYYYNLQKLSYAVENGYIPVVDWKNYGKMPHSENVPINGTTNVWEYYWKQPSEYTLDEVYKSKNVILSTRNIGQFGYIPNCSMKSPLNTYAARLAALCPKYAKLFRFNETTQAYIDRAYNEVFGDKKRVLGVVVRGSSYGIKGTIYKSHPKQVTIDELIDHVRKLLVEWELDYVYFVNEMQEFIDAMKGAFEDKLLYLPRMRDHVKRLEKSDEKNPMYADGQRYQTNLDYVTEIALLSRCTSLFGSMSSGMRTAIILNAGEYERVYVVDQGTW